MPHAKSISCLFLKATQIEANNIIISKILIKLCFQSNLQASAHSGRSTVYTKYNIDAFITNDKGMQNKLKDVNLHFMSADTTNSERSRIIDIISP